MSQSLQLDDAIPGPSGLQNHLGHLHNVEMSTASNEYLPIVRRSLPSPGNSPALAEDMEDPELCRNIREISNFVPGCVRLQVPGPPDQLHLSLQHRHEDLLHRKRCRDCLSDVFEIQGEPSLL